MNYPISEEVMNYPISEEEFQRARKQHELGMELMEAGQYEMAIEKFSKALSIFPVWGTAFLNRGLAYYYLDRFKEALADCNNAILYKPTSLANAYYNRALVHVEIGNYQQALDDFSRSINLDSESGLPFLNRGILLLKLGQADSGIADLARAVRIQPELKLQIGSSEIIKLIDLYNKRGG